MSPTRLLKSILLAITVFLLWWVDPVSARTIPPPSFFLWMAFLAYCICIPLSILPDSLSWLPAHRGVLLLLPVYFAGISFMTRNWKAPEEAPPGWIADPRLRQALHAELHITKEIRPGLVLAAVHWKGIEHFAGRWTRQPGKRKRVRTPAYFQPVSYESFPVAVQTRKDDTVRVGCRLTVKLTPKAFPVALKGRYLESMRYHGASSFLRLAPWVVKDQQCSVDSRTSMKSRLIEIITEPKTHPFDTTTMAFSDEAKGIALGMITGKSGWMNRDTKSMAAGLGILHLFAASGLHLGILYMILYWPLSMLFGPKHGLATVPPLLITGFYVWLLGFPVSLVRAFLFVSLFALRSFVHRRITTSDHLLNTALLTALFFPESMISLSALLSFSAVGGILFLFEPVDKLFSRELLLEDRRPLRWFRKQITSALRFLRVQGVISFTASLPVTPWILLIFRSYAFLSPLANIIIVPLAGILLPLLFLSVISHAAFPDGLPDRMLWYVTIHGYEWLISIMQWISVPALFVDFENIYPVFGVSALLFLFTALLLYLHQRETLKKNLALAGILFAFLLTGPVGFFLYRWSLQL